MRIKKDKTNRHASSIITRDKRHDKSFDGLSTPAKKKKKNTKKWCKGIEGRNHKLIYKECRTFSWRPNDPWMEIACENCGKFFLLITGYSNMSKDHKKRLLDKWNKKLGIEHED